MDHMPFVRRLVVQNLRLVDRYMTASGREAERNAQQFFSGARKLAAARAGQKTP
jgi:hypothetical protein